MNWFLFELNAIPGIVFTGLSAAIMAVGWMIMDIDPGWEAFGDLVLMLGGGLLLTWSMVKDWTRARY